MEQTKVFGIGFQRTSTTSLGQAFEALGYRVCNRSMVFKLDDAIGDNTLERALRYVPDHDAFKNNPWPIIYRGVDLAVPNSKFILTVRDEESWLASAKTHFSGQSRPELLWIYGHTTIDGHEKEFVERYRRHNQEVKNYFADRPNDLLVIDLTDGISWEPLCDFLGKPIPDIAFPHSNSSGSVRELFQRYSVPLAARVVRTAKSVHTSARRIIPILRGLG